MLMTMVPYAVTVHSQQLLQEQCLQLLQHLLMIDLKLFVNSTLKVDGLPIFFSSNSL